MALKENRKTNKQKIVHKRQHRNLKTKQHEPHGNSGYYQVHWKGRLTSISLSPNQVKSKLLYNMTLNKFKCQSPKHLILNVNFI